MDASAWDERYRSTELLWSAGPNLWVEDRLADAEPGVGLDLASGEGRNAIWLAQRGWKMTAVDFSGVAIERGRQLSDDVEFVEADVLTWEPETSGGFDLILVAYFHVEEQLMAEFLRRVKGWLRPGGELFLVGHDRSNIEHGVGGPQVPEILWSVDQIVGWLGDLEIIESGVVQRPVDVDGETANARDALIRARA